jgi:M6 family metalloprotease-like protein/Synergist-CTERM protein sorting domain-containing protein
MRGKVLMRSAALSLCATVLFCGTAFAVPALEQSRQMEQPDGSRITLTQKGDEFQHWFEDAKGNAVVYVAPASSGLKKMFTSTGSGRYEYAKPDGKGWLAATGVMCKPNAAAPTGAARHFRPTSKPAAEVLRDSQYKQSSQSSAGSSSSGSWLVRAFSAIKSALLGWHSRPASGDKKLLVVMVNFQNVKFSDYDPQALAAYYKQVKGTDIPSSYLVSEDVRYKNQIFAEGSDKISVKEYYKDQSHGKLNIVPAAADGVIEITLDSRDVFAGNHPDRYTSTSSVKTDADNIWVHKNECAVVDAVLKHVAAKGVDFKQFDTNGDGQVTHNELCVYMIMAGWEESFSGYVKARFPMAWAHAWNSFKSGDIAYYQGKGYKINSADHIVSVGGIELTDWAIMGELGYMSDNLSMPIPAIGTMSHELGHQMCRLPDLYDVGNYNGGISVYSVMGSGSWGSKAGELPGARPVNMDAWSRIYLGWESVKATLTASVKGVIATFGKALTNSIVRIESPKVDSTQQYILAEVRDPITDKWDMGMQMYMNEYASYDHGSLYMQHVDERVGSGSIENGNDFNSSYNGQHQGNMTIAADSDTHGSGWLRARDAVYYKNLWFNGNPALPTTDSQLAAFIAGKTYFYADANAVTATERSGIALKDISVPGETMTATVYYAAAVGSEPIIPTKESLSSISAYTEDIDTVVAEVYDNIDSAAAVLASADTGLVSSDLASDGAGQVSISAAAVKKAAGKSVTSVVSLPLFTATETDADKPYLSCSFLVSSADLMASTAGEVKLLMVKSESGTQYFKYSASPADFASDGCFTIMTQDGLVVSSGSKLTDDRYKLVLFFKKDGGSYDLDDTSSVVTAPCALVSASGKSRGGSGGCNAGFAAFALLAVVPLMFRRKH